MERNTIFLFLCYSLPLSISNPLDCDTMQVPKLARLTTLLICILCSTTVLSLPFKETPRHHRSARANIIHKRLYTGNFKNLNLPTLKQPFMQQQQPPSTPPTISPQSDNDRYKSFVSFAADA